MSLRRPLRLSLVYCAGFFLSALALALAQPLAPPGPAWAEWPEYQELSIAPTDTLARVELPLETVGALSNGADHSKGLNLRLLSPEGAEIPWTIVKPKASHGYLQYHSCTMDILRDGSAVVLQVSGDVTSFVRFKNKSKSKAFTKTVRVEGSPDGNAWSLIAANLTLFHNTTDTYSFLHFPPVLQPWVRLTFDNSTSAPVCFDEASPGEDIRDLFPSQVLPVQYIREEVPGETRLVIPITPGAFISSFQLNIKDLSFSRTYQIIQRQIYRDSIRANTIHLGTSPSNSQDTRPSLSRAGGVGLGPSDIVCPTVSIRLESQIMENQILLVIDNASHPPLDIESISVEYKPLTLVFPRPPSGRCLLLAGASVAQPYYDVRQLAPGMMSYASIPKRAPLAATPTKVAPMQANPNYKKPAAHAAIAEAPVGSEEGLPARRVRITQPGLQQLDLNMAETAARAPAFFGMLLIRDQKQVPYLLETGTLHQYLPVSATLVSSVDGAYRWRLQLPCPNQPGDLVVSSSDTFDSMDFKVIEERPGETKPTWLWGSNWTRREASTPDFHVIPLKNDSQSTTLTLLGQSRNKDEPFTLSTVQLRVPVCRLYFYADDARPLSLSTGHHLSRFTYDLGTVAAGMLLAKRSVATLGPIDEPVAEAAPAVDQPKYGGTPRSGHQAKAPAARTLWLLLGGLVLASVLYGAFLRRQ